MEYRKNKPAILITGASGGIGRAVALACAKHFPAHVLVLHYFTGEARIASLCEQLQASGGKPLCLQADLRSAHAVNNLFASIQHNGLFVDILLHTAGVSLQKLFDTCTDGDYDTVMDTNLRSTFLCCRGAMRDMLPQKRGSIVAISSMWGEAGASCEVLYSAAKAGVIGLTKALAREMAPSNIRVNCITPGVIDTAMTHALGAETRALLLEQAPLGRLGTPEDVAAMAVFLASEQAAYITGQVIRVDGGFL